jgi:sugar phosphate isomerase/epimerase
VDHAQHRVPPPGTDAGPETGRQQLDQRLGLNVPSGWWPTAAMLKGFEAAGFAWVQVHTPPRAVLGERRLALRHAAALRGILDTVGLRLILHGPDDLSAGTDEHDQGLDALLDYAGTAGAEHVAYHGLNFPIADGGRAAARARERVLAEEESLRARIPRIESLGLRLAIENLAPVFPGPPRLCHTPALVHELVLRLDSASVGMLLDLGHANVTGDVRSVLESAGDEVVLFHVHDNLGARRDGPRARALDPLRLDLHLAPGAGTVPWRALAPRLLEHRAPLMLEVAPPHRPEPLSLVAVTTELLCRGRRPSVAGSRTALGAGREVARPAVPLG